MIRIFTQGSDVQIIKDWKFTRRNINRIAYEYDAVVEKFDPNTEFATLRMNVGHLMLVDTVTKRFYKIHCKDKYSVIGNFYSIAND